MDSSRRQNFFGNINICKTERRRGGEKCLVQPVTFPDSSFERIPVHSPLEIFHGDRDQHLVDGARIVGLGQKNDFYGKKPVRRAFFKKRFNDLFPVQSFFFAEAGVPHGLKLILNRGA